MYILTILFSGRKACPNTENSATLGGQSDHIVYTVLNPFCIFSQLNSIKLSLCSNLRVKTANFKEENEIKKKHFAWNNGQGHHQQYST